MSWQSFACFWLNLNGVLAGLLALLF
uniref:Uncharacterized protein n=1 Tax=Anguilla anguilla TaxID=7936 RepID=A0A0E9UGM4_ANGAN